LTLSNVSSQTARRLQMPSGLSGALVTEVDPDGPSAGALRQGDVILSVNDQKISSASDAGRELQKVPAGRIARIHIWRGDSEIFVTVRKE
jgi:serine protease Do